MKELFSDGSFFRLGPFLIRYLPKADITTHQVLISVPKKNHKRAVVRNTIKRRIREAYRLHKQMLPESPLYLMAFIYLSKEELPYTLIEEKLKKGLSRLEQQA